MPSLFPHSATSIYKVCRHGRSERSEKSGGETDAAGEAKTFPQKCNLDLTERLSVSGSETKRERRKEGDKEI